MRYIINPRGYEIAIDARTDRQALASLAAYRKRAPDTLQKLERESNQLREEYPMAARVIA